MTSLLRCLSCPSSGRLQQALHATSPHQQVDYFFVASFVVSRAAMHVLQLPSPALHVSARPRVGRPTQRQGRHSTCPTSNMLFQMLLQITENFQTITHAPSNGWPCSTLACSCFSMSRFSSMSMVQVTLMKVGCALVFLRWFFCIRRPCPTLHPDSRQRRKRQAGQHHCRRQRSRVQPRPPSPAVAWRQLRMHLDQPRCPGRL